MSGLTLRQALEKIGETCHDVWVEAGGTLFASLIAENLLNRGYLYLCPKLLGDAGKAAFTAFLPLTARRVHWSALGRDGLCTLEW